MFLFYIPAKEVWFLKNREVSSRALSVWVATAMIGPVALVAARSSWSAVAVVATLCGVLCAAIYKAWGDRACHSKLVNVLFILWHIYAAAELASMASLCWPGRGSQLATSLVLIALAALSATKGERSASAVAAILCPLCAVIFAIVLACGIGNMHWSRVEVSTHPPAGSLIFVFLLPITAIVIPRKEQLSVGGFGIVGLLGTVLSIAVMGTLSLSVMLTKEDAFYEFSKSLDLFGAVQRFESIAAVGVMLSLYAMLSLLLSGVGSMAQQIRQGSGRWGALFGAAVSAAVVILDLRLSETTVAIVSILLWGFTAAAYGIICEKNQKKRDICS